MTNRNRRNQYRRPGAVKSKPLSQVTSGSYYLTSIFPTSDVNLDIANNLMKKIQGTLGSGEVTGSMEHRIQMSLELRNLFAAWIKSYVQRGDFDGFKAKWKWARTVINLQTRLLVEQVLFDFGNPWKSLVTGFGSI